MAASTRTSALIGVVVPTRVNEPLSSTRSSFTCSSCGISVISSRNSVPPWARSKYPLCCRSAPVNEPFSCPKSSLSISWGDTAPQLSGRNGDFFLRLKSWIVCAASSFPVPLSPVISTVAEVGATRPSAS